MEIVYGIDINNIYFKRAIDMNDRALRKVTIAQTLKKEKTRDVAALSRYIRNHEACTYISVAF